VAGNRPAFPLPCQYNLGGQPCHGTTQQGLTDIQLPAGAKPLTLDMTFRVLQENLARRGAWLVRLTGLTLGCVPLLVGLSATTQKPVSQASVPAPAKEDRVPFHNAERLAFQVLFSKFTVKAAELQFMVADHRTFFGQTAWHFRANAQTIDTVRALYPLNDQFDSYSDAARLTSLQYEMYLREAGAKQDHTWRMDTGEAPIAAGVSAARVAPGTRDPLGMLYFLRTTDWKTTPEIRSPVFDGTRIYNVRARLAQDGEQVKVPSGSYNASEIQVQLFDTAGHEVRDTAFSLWLAEDASRTPVLIQADLPIGSARVELTGRD
jgi:Protein of unknown function (DUF3108)